MRDHRRLHAFQLAHRLVLEVYRITRGFPREEVYGIVAQMRSAAYSASSNIVEGCARRSEREYLRFLDISFGSLRELGYFIQLSSELGYLDSQSGASLDQLQGRAIAALAALTKALRPHQGS